MNIRQPLPAEGERGAQRATLRSMGVTYALGTFNDNFFKQAALLLAAAAGLSYIQGQATVLFSLPFILCSAWAGWLADRMPKRDIVIRAKAVEVCAMCAAVWSLTWLNWNGMLAVVFLMGLQSTAFSPALNGSVPEIFSAQDVPRVNAFLKTATTVSILLGIALAGVFLDLPAPSFFPHDKTDAMYAFGRPAVGCAALLVAVVGLLAAFGIRKTAFSGSKAAPFPFLGPLDSLRHTLQCRRRDPSLFTTLMGEAFFYCLSSFAVLCITNIGVRQLNFSMTRTSMLSVALMLGICLGAVAAGRLGHDSWRRIVVPAGTVMGACLVLAGCAPRLPEICALPYLLFLFTGAGIAAGIYLIPLISFIQIRPGVDEKGKVQGISNFCCFNGIMLSGFVLELTGTYSPALLLSGGGLVALGFMLWIARRIRRLSALEEKERTRPPEKAGKRFLGLFLRAVLSLRYRLTVKGLDVFPADTAVLVMPNHPALIDPLIIYSLLADFSPRPLSDARRMSGILGRIAARVLHPIVIPDLRQDGIGVRKDVEQGLQDVVQALRNGDTILFYPSGRIFRSAAEDLGANSGAAVILRDVPGLRVVLARTSGLWGSSFSYAGYGGNPDFARALLRGLATLLVNGIFFTPRREVTVEFLEVGDLPRDGNKRLLNARLEAFYNEVRRPAEAVPRFFWQGKKPCRIPEEEARGFYEDADAVAVPEEMRQAVYDALREAAALPRDHAVTDAMSLAKDLGLDSLGLMEFSLFAEREYGRAIDNLEGLLTVGDCLRAAAGMQAAPEAEPAPPAAWFAASAPGELQVPEGCPTITSAFAALVREAPGRALLADRSGLKTRSDVRTAAIILAARLRRLPGNRLGVMLPASPATVIVWLAALAAGKEPVFFNWTVGAANLRHCLRITGVDHIVSATALLERLERMGAEPSGLPVNWVRLDVLAAGLTLREKALGALKARCLNFPCSNDASETAAVLFTSGSESLPKAVPLTHANLLSNAKDVLAVLRMKNDDSVLAMLPPFHSFGLMVGLVMPLGTGLRAAFHPNPTEAVPIVSLARAFKLTMLAAPPTFLEALLERADGKQDLAALRYAFVGAEKCPEHVYRAFAALCPHAALCEGYGITECSPVVAVNRPADIVPGTVGHLLPAVSAVLVKEEDGEIEGRAEGDTGMLLVRGPNIFGGYLGDAPDPFVEFEGKTWYRTGDIVSMDESGRLTFRGRLKRFVKIGGEMISLPQIEAALLENFASRGDVPQDGPPLAVEAGPEETTPQIVLFTPMDVNMAEANAALRRAGLSPLYNIRRIMRVESIPLLGSGKTDYMRLKRSLRDTA
ncbi:MAG: MFS transporter [Desulfovibrio sp.]|jgi:acyl-CoA synthetase (AMP-forming)/AMP-acid ligase II/acyl carrier protein|nr:MFS transporter [Desulfovibrio sp.]